MTSQNGRAFNEWLRAQLKAKKMSQRQLAQQSGVDHSTISRLIRGDRMPSLGTATKLARGLRELRDDADTPQYLGLVAAGLDESDRTRRVRAARRRAAVRAAGPPDHGVLPRRADAPLRPRLPVGRHRQPARNEHGTERSIERSPNVGGRPLTVGGVDGTAASVAPARHGHRRQHGPLGHPRHRPGARPLLETLPGHDPDRPPPSGSRGQRTPASGAPAFAILVRALGRRAVDRDEATGRGLEPIEQRAPRPSPPASGVTVASAGPPQSRADRLVEQVVAQQHEAVEAVERRARSDPGCPARRPSGVVGDVAPGRAGPADRPSPRST